MTRGNGSPGWARAVSSRLLKRSPFETDHYPLLPDYAMPARLFRSSEREAPNVPVHQPPDREDDKDQPEYAANPDGSALTVIATSVKPKPAAKENHEHQDDQN